MLDTCPPPRGCKLSFLPQKPPASYQLEASFRVYGIKSEHLLAQSPQFVLLAQHLSPGNPAPIARTIIQTTAESY